MRSIVRVASAGARRLSSPFGLRFVVGCAALLSVMRCGSDERTVEVIPIPPVVEACLDELEASDQAVSRLGTPAENIQLCVVLQGLDCVLAEPLCSGETESCATPKWSCPSPGLELEGGSVLDARLFIVEAASGDLACADVTVGADPVCTTEACLARIDFQLEYTGDEANPLRILGDAARITHSGYISERAGTFTNGPNSICTAIDTFTCEGDGCGTPTRLDIDFAGIGTGTVAVASEAQQAECVAPRCTVFLPSGRSATLTASAAEGSVFGDWGDACSTNGRSPTCALQPVGETVVTARFGYRLEIEVLGEGTVRSSDAGIDGTDIECISGPGGTRCIEDYVSERRVILTAVGSPEWPFTAWSGCDTVNDAVCTVSIDRAREVRAIFGRQVEVTVAGGGTVSVTPGDQVCGARCTFAFAPGTEVSLRAAAAEGSARYDWREDCAAEASEVCRLGTLDRNYSVTARFGYEVTTEFDDAQGAVNRTEDTAPVACSPANAQCRAYLPGTAVRFTAVAATSPVAAFTGWGVGLCASAMTAPECQLTVGEFGTVRAGFARAVRVGVNVVNAGQGNGTVTRDPTPNALTCGGANCEDRYTLATQSVTLTANAPTGTRFVGWSSSAGNNACTGSDTAPACTVNIANGVDRVVRADFVSEQTITVNLTGEGQGTVVPNADPASPNWQCSGRQCSGDFEFGQTVTFSVQTPASNHLEAFSGACTGTTCSVTIGTVDISIGAEFEVERTLQLTVAGGTGGSVVLPSSFEQSNALTCTGNCSRTYLSGRAFSLAAERPINVVFGGWQGCNSSSGTSCDVVMDADPKTLTATFLPARTLDIEVLGSGTAQINITGGASPNQCAGSAPLNCPAFAYPSGTSVTLTVPATLGTDFVGWGGDCASFSGSVCTLQMSASRTVTARFAQRTHDIEVTVGGAAASNGRVEWVVPSRPTCGGASTCTETVNEGTDVQLRAVSVGSAQFDRWMGCDLVVSGNECRLNNVTTRRPVTAEFVPLNDVTVELVGSGTGRVVWVTPVNPNCELSVPGTCPPVSVVQGSAVTLRAEAANADTEFIGWSGCDSTSGATCTLSSVTSAETVTATFVALHSVQITLAGDGNGRVEWTSPSFADCVPGTCPARQVRQGTTVTLTAAAVPSSSFTQWSGCPSPSGNVCTINSLSQDVTVSAFYFDDRQVTVRMRGSSEGGLEMWAGTTLRRRCPITPVPYECSEAIPYTDGSIDLIALTTTATAFDGWSQGCSGTGTCQVNVQSAASHIRRADFN